MVVIEAVGFQTSGCINVTRGDHIGDVAAIHPQFPW